MFPLAHSLTCRINKGLCSTKKLRAHRGPNNAARRRPVLPFPPYFRLNTYFHGDPGSPSPVIDREVKLPAQAADDTVVRCAGGKIVQFILREGDGVNACTNVPVLQIEPQCDVQLSLFVLNNSQIFQVTLQKPIQRFQLVGVQQAVVNCSMENTRM